MSISTANETLTVKLPSIPYLSSYPFTASVPISSLRTLLRLVVIIATYLLFRPQLERLFRRAMGSDDPQSVQELKGRMREIEKERGQPIGGGRKVAMVTSSGAAMPTSSGSSPKTRRKA